MKKQLQRLSILALLVGGFALQSAAQNEVKARDGKHPEIVSDVELTSLKMKEDYSAWKLPVNSILQLTQLERFVSFLWQDTSAVFVNQDGEANHYTWQAVGAAFTPNDPNLELADDNIRLSRFNKYTVDSVFFPYLYVRYVDSIMQSGDMVPVVDTLVVQFFRFDNLEEGGFTPTGGDREIFMKPDNYTQNFGGSNNAAFTLRIPLTAADSTPRPSGTGWGSLGRTIALPEDFDIDSDVNLEFRNVFGFSISYRTMVPFEFGDTMEVRDGSAVTKKLNYFGHSFYSNSSVEVFQTDRINNSWWVQGDIGYGEAVNGWENALPGNAYFDDRYFNYGVHISTNSLGTEELNDNVMFGVYPNPISASEILKADFNLNNGTDVEIEIYDLLGNKVKDVVSGYYAGGEHTVDVSITDLTAGVYVYTIKAGNSVASKKITVVN